MKKLILGMVFVLLTALFIAFNYLLLDRESREKELKNLEYANASNNASINAQKREIDTLEEENKSLEDKINLLEKEKEQLIQGKNDLNAELNELENDLKDKVGFINTLKQHIDIKVLSEPINGLVEALNQGKYEEAYELEYAAVPEQERRVSPKVYAEEMEKNIRRIEVGEIKLDKLRGSSTGEIFLEVRLNVKLTEEPETSFSRFSDGVNDRYIKIEYSTAKKTFIIAAISTV